MILTLYYMYATFIQSWRLGHLRNKLKGTLHTKNALLVASGRSLADSKHKRCLENLLFQNNERIACTIVPRQNLNMNQWLSFPKDCKRFPIHFEPMRARLEKPYVFVLLQAHLDTYTPHNQANLIELENYGDLFAWRLSEFFEVVLRTDLDKITKLMHSFTHSQVDINHDLKLIHFETIEIEGLPMQIKYDCVFSIEERLKYSYAPIHWSQFVHGIKQIYSKINDKMPKITLENGTKQIEDTKKHKKVATKQISPSKNTLEVHAHTSGRKKHEDAKKAVIVPKLSITTAKDDKKPSNKVKSYSEVTQNKNFVRQNATSSKETSPNRVKPPNILVYADTLLAKENVKDVLKLIINQKKYTIYDLPTNEAIKLWDSATLVVICGNVTPNLTNQLLDYLLSGGHLLCLCSDLLYSVLQTYTTAEVREHELVRFSYNQWKSVKMMHHIFCYQASPAKKQFSKDSDSTSSNHSNGSSPIAAPRTPNIVEITHNGQTFTIHVQILGAEETWQTPSLLLANVKNSSGKAIFSQVHLEVDPTQYQDDESKFTALKASNVARLGILKHILANHLEIDCTSDLKNDVKYTSGYLLGRHDLKLSTLANCEHIIKNRLEMNGFSLDFCGKGVEPGVATPTHLPVLILSCPSNFSTVHYFETLETKFVGRLVIYSDVMTSSQLILNKKLHNGLVVIPKQQTDGIGRSNNKWLSPDGCAMFSLQLHIALDTPLGQSLPLIQHLLMVAIVSAIKSMQGLECLDVGIKWPNDLYAYGNVKIGGLIVNSTIYVNEAVINIGCGINLNNTEPTMCINDMICKHNLDTKSQTPPIQYESFFGLVFNETERILNLVQTNENGLDHLFNLYYSYWLHSDAEISVSNANGELKQVRVMGVDKCGFLLVRDADGVSSSVQPDGNTFDMLKGLIAPKIY